jgi:Nitrate/TMAO reductases, membrane-bound tetraheme cytochrome c subunit
VRSIRKLLRTLRSSPRPGTTVGRLVGVGIATTVVVALAAYALVLHPLLERTNTTEFCVSCHSMEATVYREYRTSVHYSNASGVRAGCPDCHVPKPLVPKLIAKVRAGQGRLARDSRNDRHAGEVRGASLRMGTQSGL